MTPLDLPLDPFGPLLPLFDALLPLFDSLLPLFDRLFMLFRVLLSGSFDGLFYLLPSAFDEFCGVCTTGDDEWVADKRAKDDEL